MVEFQYFDGCPNSEATLRNLIELIKEKIIPEDEVKIVKIINIEDSKKLSFQGSPTILINSKDIYTDEIPQNSNYSCRSYVFDGIRTGVLSKEFIKAKYYKYREDT